MAYISLMNWKDKLTQKSYKIGEIYDASELNEGRLAELLSPFNHIGGPVIRYIPDKEESEEEPETVEEAPGSEEVDLNELKVEELKALLDKEGIEYDSKAKKADLIELLEK